MQKTFQEKFPLKELNNLVYDSYSTTEKSHGREETRLHIVSNVPDKLIDFTFSGRAEEIMRSGFLPQRNSISSERT